MADTAGQWHALIDCYGRHRRQVARSNFLLWPTPQARDAGTAKAVSAPTAAADGEKGAAAKARVVAPPKALPPLLKELVLFKDPPALHIYDVVEHGQMHALIGCYGRHRRPVARSNWLL